MIMGIDNAGDDKATRPVCTMIAYRCDRITGKCDATIAHADGARSFETI